jgi:membrane protein required for colicin V production
LQEAISLRQVGNNPAPIRRPAPTLRIDDLMPITLLDIIVLAVMLLSGLLAMVRGFMREVLSIAAWASAAIVTVLFYQRFVPVAKEYIDNEIVATAGVIGGLFIGTLILASIITVRVSDMILDSRIGALDRTLGFLFGLGRGLLIVVVAFLFFNWLVPDKTQPNWVRSAKSLGMLQSTGNWLMEKLPDDPESTILKKFKRQKGGDEAPAEAAPPAKRTDAPADNNNIVTGAIDGGYAKAERDRLRQLIEGGKATSSR